ncbi:MAG: ArsR family transcriptional regulator [Thermanaerothrix sp.]|nr:ArsR family transcriptional regulator [Thermanaerothrix sp.]
MEDTRSTILSFVAQHPLCTAREISHALNLTTADVRYHLNILVKEDKIQRIATPNKTSRRGRPATYYRLKILPSHHTLLWLCELLIKALSEIPTDSFENPLTSRLSPYFSALIPPATNPALRLNQTVDFLKSIGYDAHWEAHYSGPVLILYNCPYWPLPLKTLQICALDGLLLEKLSGLQLEQTQRANLESDHPTTTCWFKTISPGSKTGANP